jgi:hypothetical protein
VEEKGQQASEMRTVAAEIALQLFGWAASVWMPGVRVEPSGCYQPTTRPAAGSSPWRAPCQRQGYEAVRVVKHARYYWLLLAKGHLMPAVWWYGTADCGVDNASRVERRTGRRNPMNRNKLRGGTVSDRRLKSGPN